LSFRKAACRARGLLSDPRPNSRHHARLAIDCQVFDDQKCWGVLMRHLRLFARVELLVLAIAACGDPSAAPASASIASVVIWPSSPLAVVGDTILLTATAYDSSGKALSGHYVYWSSKDDSKATMANTGVVSAKTVSSVEITATIGQIVASTTVRIVPAPVATRVKDFFTAFSWPGKVYTGPVPTQTYDVSQCPETPLAPCLQADAYRAQWNDVTDWQTVATWAADPGHRGHLYTVGDDVNAEHGFGGKYWHNPGLYAVDYCTFVRNVSQVDLTAEFGTSMFHPTEPTAMSQWLNEFADSVLSQYKAGKCGSRPIAEWTFNVYAPFSQGAAGFADYVGRWAAWTVSRPAPIAAPVVLGAFVLGWPPDDVPDNDPRYLERVREVKTWLFSNRNIRQAKYLLFEPWHPEASDPHPLADANGNLNATGRAYAEVTGRIAGTTSVRPNVSCIWTAETTGGPAPYTYEWLVNGAPVGSRQWLLRANSGSPFTLQLRVTDANGARSTATIDVSVSTNAPTCAPL
jgi:hypothetical protein